MKLFTKIDTFCDKIHNGLNHAVFTAMAVVPITHFYGLKLGIIALAVMTIFFYLMEVWQTYDRDNTPLPEAFYFWEWKFSKIEDVIYLVFYNAAFLFLWVLF